MDWSKLTEQVSSIKVKNVVDMPMFYGLFTLVLGSISSIFSPYEWVSIVIFCCGSILIAISIFGYVFFSFKNPDYLRSEQYQLKKQSLEILGDKDNLLPVDAENIVLITNPEKKTLTELSNNDQDGI